MDLNALLVAYGESIGLPDLRLDGNNVCHILFGDRYDLFFEPSDDDQLAHLYSILGEIPFGDVHKFYDSILDRNLFGSATGHSTICVDRKRSEVLLYQAFNPSYLTSNEFVALVERFRQQVIRQKFWLERYGLAGDEDPADTIGDEVCDFALKV